jgi:NitT/TauT family transport system substrate-binding protein
MKKLLYTMMALLLSALTIMLFQGCEDRPKSPLRLSATSWAGHTPLLYLEATGRLTASNIKVTHVSQSSEALDRMQRAEFDGIIGTGYDYARLAESSEVIPVIVINRSNGAEAIFSNRSTDELKQTSETISVYVQSGSSYEMMVDTFLRHNDIEAERVVKKELNILSFIEQEKHDAPLIVMAFEPFLDELKKTGYTELANSAETPYLMIEALLVTQRSADDYEEELEVLSTLIAEAVSTFERDPRNYYDTILPYLQEQPYESFLDNARSITWVKGSPEETIRSTLKQRGMSTKSLIERD